MSQTVLPAQLDDTAYTNLPNDKIRILIRDRETLKIVRIDKRLCDSTGRLLLQQVANRDSVIGQYIKKDSIDEKIIVDFNMQLVDCAKINAVSKTYIGVLEKTITRKNWTIRFAIGGGAIFFSGFMYEVFKK